MKRPLAKVLRRLRDRRGTSLLLIAILIPAILGAVALVIDVGHVAQSRRQMQNAADAAALAGAQELPTSPANAEAVAKTYASDHGVSLADGDVRIYATNAPNDTIEVTARGTVSYYIARAIGFQSTDVKATATAIVQNVCGVSGVMPWALVVEDVKNCSDAGGCNSYTWPGPTWPNLTTLKYSAQGNLEPGNFGALAFGGTGSQYKTNIINGGPAVYCCDSPSPDNANPYSTEPGNKVGLTRQGIQDRLAGDICPCSGGGACGNPCGAPTFHDGTYWVGTQPVTESKRTVVVPIVTMYANGRSDVYVVGFMSFFISGIVDQDTVQGYVLPNLDYTKLLTGCAYVNPLAPITVRLIK